MYLCDIQKTKNNKIKITFASENDYEDIVEITINESDAWDIHDHCVSYLTRKERNIDLNNLKRVMEVIDKCKNE